MKWLKSLTLPPLVDANATWDGAGKAGPVVHRPVYAIGDVHGRSDLLTQLLGLIRSDIAASNLGHRATLVLLGDYIDRGPASREVLELILQLQKARDIEVIALKGNHEAALLNFLQAPEYGPKWAKFGGLTTLASYGVVGPRMMADRAAWTQAHAEFVERLPPDHLQLLWSMPAITVIDDYAFVHAGVDPLRPIRDQDEDDLLWIRGAFLQDDTALEKVIVHGHTPEEQPFSGRRRIGVDTGAYATGVLTAIRLFGASRTFLQAREKLVAPDLKTMTATALG